MANERSEQPFIVRFYSKPDKNHPSTEDPEGRTLKDMLNYSNDELESHHDYIQYLFPLPEKSMVNPEAVLIDLETYHAFQEDPTLRARLFEAFKRMASFYGFDLTGSEKDPVLTPKENFKKLAGQTWLTHFDHNHLRITRIIRCLRVLSLEKVATAFFESLEAYAGNKVNAKSRDVWRKAAKRPLNMRPDRDDAIGIKWLYEELNPKQEEGSDE
ncbi:opioid growth factor receptor region [Lecanosticta acicola]|uniref:Opioid growth factor receptor region n=1 Tax=Lecanosticta acicola TaxID=111012 RepID=A0AAI8Z0E8_9PEZI|nr:opioid growth factor receptor region [Lecanosticta acicola]